MDQVDILDLETLEPGSARKTVDRVYRSIRSERVRTVFCELLRPYFTSQRRRTRKMTFVGINVLEKAYLERARLFGDRIKVNGALLLVIGHDVSPALAADTIESVAVAGCISAPEDVWQVLKERCNLGIRF